MLVLGIAVLLSMPFSYSSSEAETFSPTDDAFVDETQKNTSLGTNQYLIVRRMSLINARLHTLIRFDLNTIPAGSMINSAKLNLYYWHWNDLNPTGRPLQVHRILTDWSEDTVTWNNQPGYDATLLDSTPAPGAFGWIEWDVRNGVQDFMDGTYTNYGWQVMDFAPTNNAMIYFRSKEFTDSNFRPYLELEYGKIYVDAGAAGLNNGSSWTHAFNNLQDALVTVVGGEEIWVAAGTYKPDQGGGKTPGDRTATFQLINNVKIYGGFPSGGGDWQDRDPNAHETILSGDIGATEVDPDNSYHVVTASGTNATALLDGFTITRGYADNDVTYPHDSGAGLYNNVGSPTIVSCNFVQNWALEDGGGCYNRDSNPEFTSCRFTDNVAGRDGGGIHNYDCDTIFTDCIITNNRATDGSGGGLTNMPHGTVTMENCIINFNAALNGGGGAVFNFESAMTLKICEFIDNDAAYGGAIYNRNDQVVELKQCRFRENSADDGGAMYNYSFCDPELVSCTFISNSASYGGALYNGEMSSPVLTNCLFSNNSAVNYGGAILNYFISEPVLTNCTLGANSAETGGGICSVSTPESNPTVTNSILWGNTGGSGVSAQIYGGNPVVTYSCIQDLDPDDGSIPFGGAANHNIDDDPLFININNNDLRLSGDSPCLETGSNAAVPTDNLDVDNDGDTTELTPFDVADQPRFLDGNCDGTAIVDRGAYELIWIYLGDLDGDCDVDHQDFAIFSSNWLSGK